MTHSVVPARPVPDRSPTTNLRRRPDASTPPQTVPAVPGLISGVAGPVGGRPLPGPLLDRLRDAARMDLSDVRVHRDSAAPAAIGALAFTRGRDIYLAPGREQLIGHEAWHVVQQRQGRVRPTAQVGGLPINTDPALEREADRDSRPGAIPAGPPTPAATAPTGGHSDDVVQGFFDLTSTTFTALLGEQALDQKAADGEYGDREYTTVGFEHEFGQMPKDGPLTGVSHLELAKSSEKMTLTGLPFILETDADRALELVSPPFTVATLPGTMIPDPAQVRKMESMISGRLAALISDKPTFKTLLGRFKSDPGLTFLVQTAKVEPSNIGPETRADYHSGNDKVDPGSIEAMVISPSLKASGDVTRPDISAQVNFATTLDTFEKARGPVDVGDVGEYSQPFAALERDLHPILLAGLDRFAAVAVERPRTRRYLGILARALSQQLAVPSITESLSRQQAYFDEKVLQKRNQTRNSNADDAAYKFHRKMASHVKDVGAVWIKDTPVNIALGMLEEPLDWRALLYVVEDAAVGVGISSLKPGSFFSGKEKTEYARCFALARTGMVAALATMAAECRRHMMVADRSAIFAEPGAKPGFLTHDPAFIGARQDTYIAGGKVTLPGRVGSRLHVVETRGGNALQTIDRLGIDRMVQTATGEITDETIRVALGHPVVDDVKAYRDDTIRAALRRGDQATDVAAALHVPLGRVQSLANKL